MEADREASKDCVAFYYFLLRLNEVRAAFHSYSGSRAELLNHRYAAALDTLLEDFQNFSKMVETTIDLEAAQRHEYLIRSDFDEELGDLSNRMQSAFHSIQQHSEQIRAKLGFLKTFALESVPGQGYCFRVSRKDEKELRDSKLTHIVVDSRKDGVKFKTDQLRNLSENYLQLQQDYENKQQELVTSVLEVVDGYQGAMTDLLELITELDVFSGLAHVFSTAPRSYTRPIILPPGGNITLRQCRHACLELQDSFTFIPNDVDLRRGSVLLSPPSLLPSFPLSPFPLFPFPFSLFLPSFPLFLLMTKVVLIHFHRSFRVSDHYGTQYGRQKYLHPIGLSLILPFYYCLGSILCD